MQPQLEVAFAQALLTAAQEGANLTPTARLIIYLAIDSITTDPHRSWTASSENRLELQKTVINALPEELRKISKRIGGQTISAFDIFHSISEIVDRLCPFEKVN